MRTVIFALLAHVALANNNTTEESSSSSSSDADGNATSTSTTTVAPNTTTTTLVPNTTTTTGAPTTTTAGNTTTTTAASNATTTTTVAAKANTTTSSEKEKKEMNETKKAAPPAKKEGTTYDTVSASVGVTMTTSQDESTYDTGVKKMVELNLRQVLNEMGMCKLIATFDKTQECVRCTKEGVVGYCYTMKKPTSQKLDDACMEWKADAQYMGVGTCKNTKATARRRLSTAKDVSTSLSSDMKATLVQDKNATKKFDAADVLKKVNTNAGTTFDEKNLKADMKAVVKAINSGNFDPKALGLPVIKGVDQGGAVFGKPGGTLAAAKVGNNYTLTEPTVKSVKATAKDATTTTAATTASAVTAGVSMAALLATVALF